MLDRCSTPKSRYLLTALACVLLTSPAFGQPSATCDGNQNLSGTDTLPQSFSVGAPLSNDLTMSGAGCNEQGVDFVVCFTPQLSCTVNIDCSYNPPGAATIAANIYQGSCTTSPASCINSGSGANVGSTVAALTAGTEYCIVCESSVNVTNLELFFDVDSGSCGLLPVELEEFSISRTEDDEADSTIAVLAD